jgi:hypothetical protein
VDADLDTLATALYVRVDDLLKSEPARLPWRPRVGIAPRLADAELVTLCVMQALLGFTSEARWLRYAHAHLPAMFAYLPQQPGYNKRLRKLTATIGWLIGCWAVTPACSATRCGSRIPRRSSAADRGSRHAARSWPGSPNTATAPAIHATSGGLRLHLLCTLGGLAVGAALSGAKADERQVLPDILTDPTPAGHRPGQTLIADKNYYGRDFEAALTHTGVHLLRPARKDEPEHPGTRFFKPLRQTIESINDTFKAQLDLEQHGEHTTPA